MKTVFTYYDIANMDLGFELGMDNHRVTATVVGTVYTAGFAASALVAGDPELTSISGLVLDNQDNLLPGVDGLQRNGVTDMYGQFSITPGQSH